jgi:leucyl-tRNA synthetase
MPIIPHFSNECLRLINKNIEIKWPKFEEKFLVEEFTNIVVQVNGKKRGLLKTKRNTNEEEIIEMIKGQKNISKYIDNEQIKKKIFIPNKLINIIL